MLQGSTHTDVLQEKQTEDFGVSIRADICQNLGNDSQSSLY